MVKKTEDGIEKFTPEEWNALPKEEQVVLADRKPDVPAPSGEGKPTYDTQGRELDADGVPIVNRMKEFQRKADGSKKQLEELRMQNIRLEEQMKLITEQLQNNTPKKADATIEKMRESLSALGHDSKTVEALVSGFSTLAEQAADKKVGAVSQRLGVIGEGAMMSARESLLAKIKGNDDLGAVEKYKTEIDAELDTYPKEMWGNENVVQTAVARVINTHLKDIVGAAAPAKPPAPTDTGITGGAPGGGGHKSAFEKECQEYADSHNLELSSARVIVAQKQKVDKIIASKEE